jgi:phosphoserine phosphatase RsbU/P
MEQTQVDRSPNPVRDGSLRQQLLKRRQKLQTVPHDHSQSAPVQRLLLEVDAALARMDAGTFGICETCHDSIEDDRLLVDPLCRNCLDHLSPAEQRTLERDLDLAFQIQIGLLPKPDVAIQGWTLAYHYEPRGPVSGDYCDLIMRENGAALFFIGDVMGKGVAASMLMAQLYAIFRSLAGPEHSPHELIARANPVFCEGTYSSHFATVVCGRIGSDGEVQICNAGHPLPLHVCKGGISSIESTGMPLGLFSEGNYHSLTINLEKGDSLLLYTDGLTEASNRAGEQYGASRLHEFLARQRACKPKELIGTLLHDLNKFRSNTPSHDDLTVMIIQRDV